MNSNSIVYSSKKALMVALSFVLVVGLCPISRAYAAPKPADSTSLTTDSSQEIIYSNDKNLSSQSQGDSHILNGKDFVSSKDQINRDYAGLTANNWMSGISGEWRLNEFNIPGTHDSATKSVEGNISTGNLSIYSGIAGYVIGFIVGGPAGALGGALATPVAVSEGAASQANCQVRYIDEQLNDGIRQLDLRLNTYYSEQGYPVNKIDDGENLWLLHGKNKNGGSYFAKNAKGDFLSLNEVFSYIKTFLAENPTETVMIECAPETVDDNKDKINARIKAHIQRLASEINPSTNEPYFYVSKDGENYPKLKDVRGKVLLKENKGDVYGAEGNYKNNAKEKIKNLTNFYNQYGNRPLLTNATDRINYLYSVATNGTDSRKVPTITPLEIADDVHKALFKNPGILLNREGTYLGWVNLDGETPEITKIIWSSNFFKGLEYCTITVKSCDTDLNPQTYTVLKGTQLKASSSIYDSTDDTVFAGWLNEDSQQALAAGSTFEVNGDMTFVANWTSPNAR